MKKFLVTFMICALAAGVSAAAVPAARTAYAYGADECDAVFVQALEGILPAEYTDGEPLTAEKTMVRDIALQPLGYVYDFESSGGYGYAVVIKPEGGECVCTELFLSAADPWGGSEGGLPVYVGGTTFLRYADGVYLDAASGAPLSEEALSALSERAYFSAGDLTSSTSTVTYTGRTEDEHSLATRFPLIIDNGSTMCVPVAGANIVQYYDRFSTSLIADYTPGTAIGPLYLYKDPSAETAAVVQELADRMGASGGAGVTVGSALSGLSAYCAQRGCTFSATSCMSGGSLDAEAARQALDGGMPLMVFSGGVRVYTIAENSGSDTLTAYYSANAHCMAAFGYYDVTYVFADGGTRTDRYLQVAGGKEGIEKGYYRVNDAFTDDAYAIDIAEV